MQILEGIKIISGRAGCLFDLVRLFRSTGKQAYLDEAMQNMHSLTDNDLVSEYVSDSLFDGRAGTLLVLLHLFDANPHEAIRKQIGLYVNRIVNNSVPYKEGICWRRPFSLSVQPLCSLSEGAAGIGWVFSELAFYFNSLALKVIADKAFQYVNSNWNEARQNWPDLRKDIDNERTYQQHRMAYACGDLSFFVTPAYDDSLYHGATGILLAQRRHNMLHTGIANNQYTEAVFQRLQQNTLLTMSLPEIEPPVDRYFFFDDLFVPDVEEVLLRKVFSNTIPQLKEHFPDTLTTFRLQTQSSMECNVERFIAFAEHAFPALQHEPSYASLLLAFDTDMLIWNYQEAAGSSALLHVQSIVHYETTVALLNNNDSWLLDQLVSISDRIIICRSGRQSSLLIDTWDKGLLQIDLSGFGLIIQAFHSPEKVAIAVERMMTWCSAVDESGLQDWIRMSKSVSKEELMRRLPYLLLFQIRELLVGDILSFHN